ncbi:hypothetical protein ACAW74_18725 [Fibrella sp. WM1]|uniref:hypothetical protein n=1 Tax=Fibrella musci TaxID=3242485 RepID=UPI003520EA16
MKSVLFSTLLLLMSWAGAQAQVTPVDTTTGKPYYILLNDGSHIFGRIVRRDSTMYTVKMRSGQLTYVEQELFKAVSGIAPVSADSTVYYINNAQSTRVMSATVSPGQYVITLVDGTVLRGEVLSQDTDRVFVKTTNIGTVYVPAAQVVRMERGNVRQTRPGLHPAEGYPNLFPQYLNFTPTAYQAERGRVYYRNTMVYGNQLDAGLTDNWSVGAGFFLYPFVGVGWLSTKLSVPLGPRARIGAQAQYFFGGFTFADAQFGTAYLQGLLSLGEPQNNVTLGIGMSTEGGIAAQLLTVGIVRKVGPLVTFISENQLFVNVSGGTLLKLSGGVRFDRRRHSFDLTGNVPLYLGNRVGNIFIFFPTASYQLRLGQ